MHMLSIRTCWLRPSVQDRRLRFCRLPRSAKASGWRDGDAIREYLSLLFTTGLRVGEMTGVRIADIVLGRFDPSARKGESRTKGLYSWMWLEAAPWLLSGGASRTSGRNRGVLANLSSVKRHRELAR